MGIGTCPCFARAAAAILELRDGDLSVLVPEAVEVEGRTAQLRRALVLQRELELSGVPHRRSFAAMVDLATECMPDDGRRMEMRNIVADANAARHRR